MNCQQGAAIRPSSSVIDAQREGSIRVGAAPLDNRAFTENPAIGGDAADLQLQNTAVFED
jgi:hypothetical protein